jgi:hypothetical protein
MQKRPTKNVGTRSQMAPPKPTSVSQNEKKSALVSEKEEILARAARVKSVIRKILLANPSFPRLYADVVISSAPNSHEAKILARNYQKIIAATKNEATKFDTTNRINMSAQSSVKICTHIKVTGIRCGSPALRGEQFCYFHQRMVRGVATPPNSRLHPIALIESEEAIQASLMEVINALARNSIDLKRAELILRALHIAVKNARRVRFSLHETEMVREVPTYSAPPKPAQPAAPEPPVEVKAPPLTPYQTWTTVTLDSVDADAIQRKPPARAGLPPQRDKAVIQKAANK